MRIFITLATTALLILFSLPHLAFANDMSPIDRAHLTQDEEAMLEARRLLAEMRRKLAIPASAPLKSTQAFDTREPVTMETLTISRLGDIELTCGALSSEALEMRDFIYTTQDIKDRAVLRSHGVTAAGAVGSFLIGSVTGGVGLAVGGLLLDHNINQTENEADAIQDIAKQRRTLMMGIYNAKGCYGPLEHAMQNPQLFDPLMRLSHINTAYENNTGKAYNN